MKLAAKDLLRLATVGSVDDGKSTLIGRLLVDTRQLFDDQLDAVVAASEKRGVGDLDLSFVTDGLRAEREQGITIDVAYRYASTPTRKFIIADCPGHVQYTRNMATGASTADLALVVLERRPRRQGADAPPPVHRGPARRAHDHRRRQQDGRGQLVRGRVPRRGRRAQYPRPRVGLRVGDVRSRFRRCWARTSWSARRTSTGTTAPRCYRPSRRARPGPGRTPAPGARLPVQWVLRQNGGGRTYAGMLSGATPARR